jgi:hypothetical protein
MNVFPSAAVSTPTNDMYWLRSTCLKVTMKCFGQFGQEQWPAFTGVNSVKGKGKAIPLQA